MSYRTLGLGALGAFSLSLLLAFSTRADSVAFQVADGTKLSRSLQIGMSLTMVGGTVSFGGEEQEIPEDDEPLVLDMAVDTVDTFTKVADGEIAAMSRLFDTFAIEAEGSEEGPEDIDVEGKTVFFARDESGGYIKSLEADGENEDSLAGLTVDMDFTALLPDGDVAAGDTYDVKSAGLSSVFLPGGVPFGDDGEGVTSTIGAVAMPMLAEGAEDFAVTCTYDGVKGEDGAKLAEISFEFEGSTGGDFAELIEALSDMDGDSGMPDDVIADGTIDFAGKGLLVWNVAGGHAETFEMTVEPTINVDMEVSQEMGEQVMEFEVSIEFAGELNWNMTVSAE